MAGMLQRSLAWRVDVDMYKGMHTSKKNSSYNHNYTQYEQANATHDKNSNKQCIINALIVLVTQQTVIEKETCRTTSVTAY